MNYFGCRCNPIYIRTRHSNPFFATLAATKVSEPPTNADPPNACANKNLPPSIWINAPASGGPVKHAIEITEKHIPVRVPILLRSGVRLAHAAGNRLWIPAAKKP